MMHHAHIDVAGLIVGLTIIVIGLVCAFWHPRTRDDDVDSYGDDIPQ